MTLKEKIILAERELAELKAELKKETPQPWKPKYSENYYLVCSDCIDSCIWRDDEIDHSYYKLGNCFPTKKRAEEVAEKFRELLKIEQIHDTLYPGYKPDCKNSNSEKHIVYYDMSLSQYRTMSSYAAVDRRGTTYFPDRETAEKAARMLNEGWELS